MTFPILYDPGNRAAAEYGLRFDFPDDLIEVYSGFGLDLPKHHGEGTWQLPMPARYVIDGDGKVRYAVVHADYTKRSEPEETLAALKAL